MNSFNNLSAFSCGYLFHPNHKLYSPSSPRTTPNKKKAIPALNIGFMDAPRIAFIKGE